MTVRDMDRTLGDDDWLLYWVTPGAAVPPGLTPLLDEWADIDERERALDIRPGTPILIDPAGQVDPRLARFFRRSRFAFRAEGTQQAYVKDLRLFFSFLWRRGRYWDEADSDDLDDYEAWRRRAEDNPRRIGGAKWARELAAFKLLYDWALAKGHIDRSPVSSHTVRQRDGSRVEVLDNAPKDVRTSNVRWVTPRTYRLWRDIGLRGYTAAGVPDPSWRGRNDGRNVAFADLLFESGLRLREGGCLLTLEVPAALPGHVHYEGTVAAAIAKRRERMFYVHADAVSGISAYLATTRRAAIVRARREGRYDSLAGKLIVTNISGGGRGRLTWEDARGRRGEVPVGAVDVHERRRLFIETSAGLEPLALWLTEGGLPMDYRSWEAVFTAASDRCQRQRTPIRISPHVCRHSFALKMLITLQRGLDARFGLDGDDRAHLRKVYGDAFALVKDLLGHKSEQTTREIYLEPLNSLRLSMILDAGEDNVEAILARVAASNRRVMDVVPGPGDG
ncbi:site-specific integrase [Frankia sp. Cj3]|uniref:site-specific integrase n=1 Tax=Frankia sp. Cj3 TaxID=2880976 RepID=UPI001EF4824C|nr:site-specific integrase [Frankia sp. Cj3]